MDVEEIERMEEKQRTMIDARRLGEIFEDVATKELAEYAYLYPAVKRLHREMYTDPLRSKIRKEDLFKIAEEFFNTINPELAETAKEIFRNETKEFSPEKQDINFLMPEDLWEGSYCVTIKIPGIIGITEDMLEMAKEKGEEGYNQLLKTARGKTITNITIPYSESITDLYSIAHEFTHYFIMQRRDSIGVLDEAVPQCMERIVDSFLLNLSDDDLARYNLDRKGLNEDVKRRQALAFAARYCSVKKFNEKAKDKNIDRETAEHFRYLLAQICSSQFTRYPVEEQKRKILELINIEDEDVLNKAGEILGMRWDSDFHRTIYATKAVNDVRLVLEGYKKETQQRASKMRERFGFKDIEEISH